MSNPFEFRELMKAQMRFGEERTVDQVLAEHNARHQQRRPTSEGRKRGGPTPPSPGVAARTEIDKMRALMSQGKASE
jgi:hypothetical protein